MFQPAMFGTIIGLTASAATLTPADFEITSLPGLASPPKFKQYSGLVPIGDGHGTELFFWFVESAKSPSDDPLVFWTNGGPGASSVAYGFWTEHGPFRLENTTAGIVPVTYAYSWNRIANVLYVEMPSGVGFSHSTDASKYFNITDTHAAADTVAAGPSTKSASMTPRVSESARMWIVCLIIVGLWLQAEAVAVCVEDGEVDAVVESVWVKDCGC